MNGFPLLSLLTLVPFVGALVVIGLGAEQKRLARWLALGFSLGALALALLLWHQFDSSFRRASIRGAAFVDSHSWALSTAWRWMGSGC